MRRRRCTKCRSKRAPKYFTDPSQRWCKDCQADRGMDPKARVTRMLGTARRRARARKLEFDLDEFRPELLHRLISGRCELSGLPFRLDGGLTYDSPSIDRIDPQIGYVYSNVRLVCHGVNSALGNWGEVGYWRFTVGMLVRGFERLMGVK